MTVTVSVPTPKMSTARGDRHDVLGMRIPISDANLILLNHRRPTEQNASAQRASLWPFQMRRRRRKCCAPCRAWIACDGFRTPPWLP